MAIRQVLEIPHTVLSTPTKPVAKISDFESNLAQDLIDTMRASPGCVGLAANQIGIPLRAFALDVSGHKKTTECHGLIVLFNPEIQTKQGLETIREGCMSVPHFTADIPRALEISLTGLTHEERPIEITTRGFEARAVLHEIDHLNGLVFLDRVTNPSDLFSRKVYLASPDR